MRPGPLDLNICINRLAGLLSPFERISLRTVLGGNVLLVMADPDLMAAMFFTIVECAGRLAPGGTVTIHTALAPLQTGLVSKEWATPRTPFIPCSSQGGAEDTP